MMGDNGSYYQRRIEEELEAAERAGEPGIAQIHREMAWRYREKVEAEFPLTQEAAAGRPEASLSAASEARPESRPLAAHGIMIG